MRPFLVSLTGALAIGGAVFGSGWAVEAAALPTPPRASLVAAHVAAWLYRYRRVDSAFEIGAGATSHATCVQAWFPAGGGVTRGTLLRMPAQATVITLLPHDLDVLGARRTEAPWRARAQLELAGCPRLLADSLAAADQSAAHIWLSEARPGGRTTLSLHVGRRGSRLTIALAPKTDEPVGISISTPRWQGHSVIRLAPVTAALLRTSAFRGT